MSIECVKSVLVWHWHCCVYSCFPYTPPECASEANSPPNLNDLDAANQQPSCM